MKNLSFFIGFLLFMGQHSAQVVLNTDFGMQQDSVICYFPNWPSDSLIQFTKQSWLWYERSKPASLENFRWDKSSSSWELVDQTLYTYHPVFGEEVLALTHTWDNDNQNWSHSRKESSYYDSQGLLLGKVEQFLHQDSSHWKNIKKQTYQYNLEKRLIKTIKFRWDKDSMNWTENYRIRRFYDQRARLFELLYDQKFRDSSAWMWVGKTEFLYNSFDQIIEEIGTTPNQNASLSYYYTSAYDSLQRLEEVIEYSGWPTGRTWKRRSKYLFLYDTDGKMYRANKYNWVSSASTWSDLNHCDYFGKKYPITSIEEEFDASPPFCDFPNPYQSNMPFTCEQMESHRRYTLSLLDLSGRVLQIKIYWGSEKLVFDVKIPEGLYVLLIQEGNQLLGSQKIVIR